MGEKQEAERKLSEEARKLGKEEWYSNTIERQQDDEKKGREAFGEEAIGHQGEARRESGKVTMMDARAFSTWVCILS
jgi:CRISPR/Cas system CMR subunit Cmr4 (Cas7 group RAMP superfamily)